MAQTHLLRSQVFFNSFLWYTNTTQQSCHSISYVITNKLVCNNVSIHQPNAKLQNKSRQYTWNTFLWFKDHNVQSILVCIAFVIIFTIFSQDIILIRKIFTFYTSNVTYEEISHSPKNFIIVCVCNIRCVKCKHFSD